MLVLLYIVTDQTIPEILCSNLGALIKTDIPVYSEEHHPDGRGCEGWFCKAPLTVYIRSKNSTQCFYKSYFGDSALVCSSIIEQNLCELI